MPSLEQIIIAQERRVWQALKDSDGAADARLLADDFVGVYETGFATKSEHVRWTVEGRVTDYTMNDIRVISLSRDQALILYQANFRGSQNGVEYQKVQYISSLWVRRGDEWLNVFSQDTDAPSKSGRSL